MKKGWTTKPTAKSIKARLGSKMCSGSGKFSEGVLQMAVKTTAFPKSDARHIGALIAQTKKPMDDSVTAALLDSSNSLLCSLRFMFVIILSLQYGQLRYQEKIRLQRTAISLFGLIVKMLPIKRIE